MKKNLVLAAVLGQFVGLLGWIEPVYVVFILGGPLLTGAIAAARRVSLAALAVLWISAGLSMAWVDYLVNREDVAYHLVLSFVMALLAAAGYGMVALINRLRTPASA